MDRAYLNEKQSNAICCWNSPNEEKISSLFKKAGIEYESLEEVVELNAV